MTTATVERGVRDAGLEELFADIRERDALIERMANGRMVPTDHILARKHNLTTATAAHEWRERVQGVRHRSKLAGTPSQYEAAQQRIEDADKAAEDAEKRLTPKIEAARQKLRELEAELKSHAEEQAKAKSALKTMDESRELLRGRLLPQTLQAMQGPISKAARAPYLTELQSLKVELRNIGADSGREAEIKRRVAEIEARIIAETDHTLVDVYLPSDPE